MQTREWDCGVYIVLEDKWWTESPSIILPCVHSVPIHNSNEIKKLNALDTQELLLLVASSWMETLSMDGKALKPSYEPHPDGRHPSLW